MRVIDKILNSTGKLGSFDDFANDYFTYKRPRSKKNYFSVAKDNLSTLLNPGVNPTLRRSLDSKEVDLINAIILDFRSIIIATPKEVPVLALKYTTGSYLNILYDSKTQKQKPFGALVKKAFEFKKFRKSPTLSWFAECLNIRTCLYCNAQFALTIGDTGSKKELFFQFDHFYSQSRYPFLALSFGNLIPCCSNCNIRKSDKNFDITTHIHPYLEDASSFFKFNMDEEKALNYLIDNKDPSLLAPKLPLTKSRFDNHITTFYLEDLYKKHVDIIEELLLKAFYYNESRRREIENEFKDLKIDKKVIDRFILGNYTLDSEINNRPLSKLAKDIGLQLKIIK